MGNNILVTDLMEKGFSPLALRYLVLTSHYRKGMNFTWSSLTAAQSALDKLCEFVKNSKTQNLQNSKQTLSKEKLKKLDGFRARFVSAVNNDLNFPQGLAVVWEMIKSNIPGLDKLELLLDWDQILGLGLANTQEGIKVPEEVTKLVGERESLRKAGKFVEGDKVRMQIEALGFTIKDTATGPVIKSFSSHS